MEFGGVGGKMGNRLLRNLKAGKVKLIEGDDQLRAKKCLEEINEILERYDCVMMPEVRIFGPQLQARVAIVPKIRRPMQ